MVGRLIVRRPSVVTPPAQAVTGLEWDGNENTLLRRMLYWDDPFPIYDATYIFRAFPKGPKTGNNPRYWTMFFWSNNGTAAWQNGSFQNTYYGAHPYPYDGNNQNTGQNWELSVNSSDYPPVEPNNGAEATWNRWYTQVFRAWRTSASATHHEFYYDWPDTSKLIEKDLNDSGWANEDPPVPCICVGQSADIEGVGASSGQSWGGYAGYEEYKGILRGFQFYGSLLTLQEIADELDDPGSSTVTPWYLNLNPTPDDVTDKSGSGNHPLWDGDDRPELWTDE